MSDLIQNTLYVMTQGAYVHRDHEVVKVEVDRQVRLSVPIHHLDSLVAFGRVMISPSLLQLCAQQGVAVTFLSEHGRLLARLDAPQSGNVLLRRAQYRLADQPDQCLRIARNCVAGKLHNGRNLLLRAARETEQDEDRAELHTAAKSIGQAIESLPGASTLDSLRGHEGAAAAAYFDAFNALIRQQRETFRMNGRTRRPPLDPVNALLSFAYALLTADAAAALTSAGLDPSVGFLHVDRPGRPGLALDLVEEFRPIVADRLVLAMINRKQIAPTDFSTRPGGAVELSDAARRAVITAYQHKKAELVKHPTLECTVNVGRLSFLQAKLLARTVRGEMEDYVPLVLK